MLSTNQLPSPSLKDSRGRTITLLIQLSGLFFLFIAIASFMLIILSNFGLNFIDANIHPIIPKHYREQIAQESWNDRSSGSPNKNHGVLYCPLKYENLQEEVAESWHSTRNYYECPVPMGQGSMNGDSDAVSFDSSSIWNLAGQSGISRVVCCENNRCCTTHQWMDFTLFYSIMSRYAPWPVILLVVMLFTTFLTVAILACFWQFYSLFRDLCTKSKHSDVLTGLSNMSPTLSEIDPLYIRQCNPDNMNDNMTMLNMNANGNNGTHIINNNNLLNHNNNNPHLIGMTSGSCSNGSSTGSQSTTTTGGLTELHSRTNSSLSMTTLPPQMGNRMGHVSLMTPPHSGQSPMNCNPLASFDHQNSLLMMTQYPPQNTMSLARNSMSFQPGQQVPSPTNMLPSPTEVPKVNLATTFQWQNSTSRNYESVNAHDLNPITNVII